MGREVQKNPEFSFSVRKKAFLYKLVLRGIRNFPHSPSERLACFETQPSSEATDFQAHFVLHIKKLRFYKDIMY